MTSSPTSFESSPDFTIRPSRTVVSGRRGSLVTFFASQKNRAPVGCESLLEADACLYLEYLPEVISYEAQPYTIQFTAAGLRYTPDLLANLVDGRQVLIEVKSESAGRDPRWQQRHAWLADLFGTYGLHFQYMEEHTFCPSRVLDNLRYLYHCGYHGSAAGGQEIIRILRQSGQSATVYQVMALGGKQCDIAYALFHQQVRCNLELPINLNHEIWTAP
jgi:hypothetical protein